MIIYQKGSSDYALQILQVGIPDINTILIFASILISYQIKTKDDEKAHYVECIPFLMNFDWNSSYALILLVFIYFFF